MASRFFQSTAAILVCFLLTMVQPELASGRPVKEPVADLVLKGGKIWTGDKAHPEAEALAVWHERILLAGSDVEIKPLIGPATRVIDLHGRRVVPGFNDSHVHLLGGGTALSQVALKDAADEAEFGRRLRQFDAKLPHGRWIIGGSWDHDRTFAGKLPDAALVDRYVRDRPVYIRRYDGHMALANSHALRVAGITATTADPVGGVIVRGADGRTPSGILRDNAMQLVERVLPPPSEAEVAEALQAALAEARSFGVTTLQDMDGSDARSRRHLLRILQRQAHSGDLTARVDERRPIDLASELTNTGIEAGFGSDRVTIGGVKGFMDGSLGSNTAKMFEPFLNEPGSTGIYVTPRARMLELIRLADQGGLSVAIHAIGDQANAELLDMFQEVSKLNGPRDRRFRIEHAQHLRPADYPRFREIGVIASMQPYHVIDDGRWAEGRIGAKRCASSYAYRSLLDAGAHLAFGTDWPVAPLDPFAGLDAAVNRRTLGTKDGPGWFPDQKISIAEALEAYTSGSAYAAFQEKDRGTLQVGKLADMVVLSRDILAPAERDHIAETHAEITIVGGKVVFERKP
jgi:predicted amidohydrolase YtcJ